MGITNGTHKGERSGVLEEAPRAIINPFKETAHQNGRRIKNPNGWGFKGYTGVYHQGSFSPLVTSVSKAFFD